MGDHELWSSPFPPFLPSRNGGGRFTNENSRRVVFLALNFLHFPFHWCIPSLLSVVCSAFLERELEEEEGSVLAQKGFSSFSIPVGAQRRK